MEAELEAVIASGQLGILTTHGLRRALGGWPLSLEESDIQAKANLEMLVTLIDESRGFELFSAMYRGREETSALRSAWAHVLAAIGFRDAAAVLLLVTRCHT